MQPVNSLKLARTYSGLTQVQLSAKSGVALGIINGLETDRREDVRLSTMIKISNALNKPVEDVFSSFFTMEI